MAHSVVELPQAASRDEQWYRQLVEQVRDWLWVLDEELKLVYASPRVVDLLGYEPEEVLGKAFFDLMPPDEIERVRPLVEPVLRRREPVTLLGKEFLRKDGSRVAVESSGEPVFDEHGLFRGYRGTTRDVTARRAAEQALRESEARFRATLESVPVAVVLLDNQRVVRLWNRAAERIFQVPAAEVIGRPPFYSSEANREFYQGLAARARSGETVEGVEWHSTRRDGQPFDLRVSMVPVRDDRGTVLGLLAMLEDISERKRAEVALQESEERFRATVESAPLTIVAIDNDNIVRMWNRAAERMFLRPSAEVVGGMIPYTSPAQKEFYEGIFQRVRAGERVEGVEWRSYRKDGTPIDVSVSAGPIHNERGEIVGLMGIAEDISERKRAEAALRQSESRFRATVDGAPVAVVALDSQNLVRLWNPAAERMFGWRAEEVIGRQIPYTDPRFQAWYEGLAARVRAGEVVQGAEFRSSRQDGTPIDVSVSVAVVRHNGTEVALIGMVEDITERKRAENELRESEEQFRALFTSAPLAIASFDLQGRVRRWNPAAERMTGWREDEVSGSILPYDTADEEAAFEALIRRALAGENLAGEEVLSYRRGGTPFYLRVSSALMHDREGRPTGVMAVGEDITAAKQAQEALERERAFLSTAVDIIPFPVGFIAPDGEMLQANRAAMAQLPLERFHRWQEAVLLRPDTRTVIPPEEWPIQRALRGEVMPPVEVVLRFPDGAEMPALLTVAPITAGGHTVAAVWALQDITWLKQADREKDEFLAFLSHELLTPLTSIMGWTQAARRAPDLADQAMEVITRNAERQRQIVNDLLDVSRIIHGKLEIEPLPIDLWALARDSVEDFAPDFREKGLQAAAAPPVEALPVVVDTRRLRQAIGNLLSNAVKFTRPGDTITVSAHREGDWAVLAVHDTGRGIRPDVLPTLFAPFRQVERRPENRGLGLGLALVRGIVERHGGQVRAQSPGEGQGSTFLIRLPLAGLSVGPEILSGAGG